MRDIFKRLLLNVQTDDRDLNNLYRYEHASGHDRFVFEGEEDYAVPKKSSGAYRTISGRPKEAVYYGDFNSDTKLSALGGLSIWQFTAILIASLMLFGKF